MRKTILDKHMIAVPQDFQFTQGNLQDYLDCRRRFQLRHLEELPWPAVEAEPIHENERRLQLGSAFHSLVQQHLLGVPASRIGQMLAGSRAAGTELGRWWENYLDYASAFTDRPDVREVPQVPLVEATLTAPLGNYRLVAKYDVIFQRGGEPGSVVIIDWKTTQKRPSREWLAGRTQTKVYPFILACATSSFENSSGAGLQPGQIELVYWFPEFPREPERFLYSQEQFDLDRNYLEQLVAEIEGLDSGDFHLTSQVERCAYCTYRSLCDRGVRAGSLDEFSFDDEFSGDLEVNLDFDQIAEIEF
jgi:hypothetical protein